MFANLRFAVAGLGALAPAAIPDAAAAQSPVTEFALVALGAENSLWLFRADAPQETRFVRITGGKGTFIGLDTRPMDRKLYGITDSDTIYVIDPRTGVAKAVSRLGSPFDGGMASGFDFNPQSDRLRLVAANGQNLRVNVDVGAVAIDGPLTYARDDDHAGKRPRVAASAYTNAVARARSTVTFGIDCAHDTLVRQEPPNEGVLETVGPLGIDCGEATGFDIATDARGADHGFLVSGSDLYRIDLESGAVVALGAVGGGEIALLGLAVLPEPGLGRDR